MMCISLGVAEKEMAHLETAQERNKCNQKLLKISTSESITSSEREELKMLRLKMIILQNKVKAYHELHDEIMEESEDKKMSHFETEFPHI